MIEVSKKTIIRNIMPDIDNIIIFISRKNGKKNINNIIPITDDISV